MPETTPERLTDERLRSIASPDWVAHDESAGEEPNSWAETARDLAAEVLELRQRVDELEMPPIGYAVLAKRPDRVNPHESRYDTAGSIWPEREPVNNHRGHCEDVAREERPHDDVEYIVAEIREAAADV